MGDRELQNKVWPLFLFLQGDPTGQLREAWDKAQLGTVEMALQDSSLPPVGLPFTLIA